MKVLCTTLERFENCFYDIESVTQLVLLNISGLVSLPKWVMKASHLNHLIVSGCPDFTELPENMDGLHSLEMLEIRHCSLFTILPDSIAQLKQLKALALYETGIRVIPSFVSQLSNLEILTVSGINGSRLIQTPKLDKLSRLHTLILDVGVLPAMPDLSPLTELKRLVISGNRLQFLHESISSLLELRILSLGGMTPQGLLPLKHVNELPKNLDNLKKLRRLFITARAVRYLPETVCRIPRLQVLKLKECDNIKELPIEIGKLEELQKLELLYCNSNISPLPDSLSELPNLDSLLIDSYNFEKLPLSVLFNKQIDIRLHEIVFE